MAAAKPASRPSDAATDNQRRRPSTAVVHRGAAGLAQDATAVRIDLTDNAVDSGSPAALRRQPKAPVAAPLLSNSAKARRVERAELVALDRDGIQADALQRLAEKYMSPRQKLATRAGASITTGITSTQAAE